MPLVKDFAERFYNVSYQSWNSDLGYLKARLTDDYLMDFEEKYYPLSRKQDLQNHQEVQYFSKGQPPVVLLPTGPQAGGRGLGVPSQGADGNGGTSVGSANGGHGNSVVYRMEGQITLQYRGGRSLQNIWSKPVALEISVRHVEGMGYRVERVTEIQPGTQAKGGNGPTNGQEGDPAAKFVGDAVGDAAKKLLGL